MRTAAFTLVAAATLATAQLGSIPSCATSCISQALPASCNLDPKCICSDASFISTISCCVSTACDTSGQSAALAYASQICAPVGVTNLPTAASCASGSASGTSAAAVATATGSSASTSLSSATQSLSSLASSASKIASSAASSGSSSARSATSSAASAASSVASSASSAASAQSTGAAATMGPAGLAGAVALGAFALL
ncbi:hypothetical protein E4T42_06007 [Aureobasidium subglaciale]|uniref:CFEM domain-containing protein n=1 Tax=Aureobasidium subglaciale (strain EXF-2481) TaxID=1043005 RepID=A0A074YB59_AURSE|nr:uncharacterized protein AUEXF2481DRAFT_80059 [Aureobasidium subglaciale EXF-2481]KAI5211569.1 hypothetical protein E4T38_01167 [Aureobasidium subglaciale]KAI5230270.1 hypothetical protein E4T40_01168 [Aureobasidium subglaciale]KAI5233719.1 hypothetical protein E4T41_01166 [Aureobasidium subglaciale]KAI5247387.1 hypothetical protein E4T42_06007 [Aureobasidium subglaciale]KAI5266999.1 hypothetical protein E4T46_01166 [Aureobasidium subglaciale]